MKSSHNPRLEKQNNGQQASSSPEVNLCTPGCPMPLYIAEVPKIYVLPHPPLMYQMNSNQRQPAYTGRTDQQFSTRTNLSTDNYTAQSDNPNQPSSEYPSKSNQNERPSQSTPIATPQQPKQSAHPFYTYSSPPRFHQSVTTYPVQSSQKGQFSQSTPNLTSQQPQQPPPPYYIYPTQEGRYQQYYGAWQATAPPPPGYPYGAQYPPPPLRATDSPMVRETAFRRSGEEAEPEGWTGFLDKKVRTNFIRKVYIILTLQLLFTLGIIALFIYEPNVRRFVQKHHYLTYVAMAVFFSVYIGLACFQSVRRRFPINIIALAVFTMAMSYMAATISTVYDTDTVLIAVGICAAVCFTVTIFSFYTKFDFTTCGGILCILLLILFLCGIITIFFPTMVMRMIYAGLGATVFTFMLAYDTQMMMGGKHYELSPEEYVFAAVQIYLDIVYIFLFLLMLLGGSDE